MTRRIVWIAVLVLAALTLGGAWFLANFERVPVKEWTPPEAAARRDSYLALDRFLARMGRPLVRETDPRRLETLPANGVLILDRNRRHHMTPARVDKLLAWVEAGGYLILVPELQRVSDPVLERLGIRWFDPASRRPAPAEEDDAEDEREGADAPQPPPAAKAPAGKRPPWPKQTAIAIPDGERTLYAGFRPGLEAGKIEPDWVAGNEGFGDQFLHFSRGRGQITIASGLDSQLHNQQIGSHDHAEILWRLVQRYQPDPSGQVFLMSKLAVPTLWEWLAESAWAAVASGLALLGLWLWRRLPRFGPVAPEPEASRRELREHLTALGRYVWRAGGLGHWLRIARDDFQGRLALRHPAVANLAPADQAAALAKMSHRSQSLIAAALFGPAESPHSFTAALRTLRNLERIL